MSIAQSVSAAPDTRRLSSAGLKAFFNIASSWKLTVGDEIRLLGEPARATYFNWKRDPSAVHLSRDTLERISYILGIYKALQILLPEAHAADAWIKKPNSATLFGGRSALDLMLSGNVGDLYAVRQYLDAMRGGWA